MVFLPESELEKRRAKDIARRKLFAIIFWSISILLLAFSSYMRFTASPLQFKPAQRYRISAVDVEKACISIQTSIQAVSIIEPHQLKIVADKLTRLEGLIQGLSVQLPRGTKEEVGILFIKDVKDLKVACDRWMHTPVTMGEVPKMQQELLTFQPRFEWIVKRLPRPPSIVHKHLLYFSMGYTEGLVLPVLLGVRTIELAFSRSFSLLEIVDPSDLRRTGISFLLGLSYGTLILIYVGSWLGMHYKRPAFYAPGIIGVLVCIGIIFGRILMQRNL